ncbi:MAG: hypothetical protein QOH63_3021 [Acidobacteriota bacterium]|jgi:hypothetical protein|nr:hypothetical protein [Acidobacteriota bacterium]
MRDEEELVGLRSFFSFIPHPFVSGLSQRLSVTLPAKAQLLSPDFDLECPRVFELSLKTRPADLFFYDRCFIETP